MSMMACALESGRNGPMWLKSPAPPPDAASCVFSRPTSSRRSFTSSVGAAGAAPCPDGCACPSVPPISGICSLAAVNCCSTVAMTFVISCTSCSTAATCVASPSAFSPAAPPPTCCSKASIAPSTTVTNSVASPGATPPAFPAWPPNPCTFRRLKLFSTSLTTPISSCMVASHSWNVAMTGCTLPDPFIWIASVAFHIASIISSRHSPKNSAPSIVSLRGSPLLNRACNFAKSVARTSPAPFPSVPAMMLGPSALKAEPPPLMSSNCSSTSIRMSARPFISVSSAPILPSMGCSPSLGPSSSQPVAVTMLAMIDSNRSAIFSALSLVTPSVTSSSTLVVLAIFEAFRHSLIACSVWRPRA
mmetsp:Transcript_1288/g.2822  ORF Transcript_1288/g.2822 Transcript_1288/m.2822 type:complete len:360 (+) Transcript_1288:684-1763(+)